MKARRPPWWLRRARRLCRAWSDRLENCNDPNSHSNGEYRLLQDLVRAVPPATTWRVFDVGANVGDYTAELIAVCERHRRKLDVHAFEPAAACQARLRTRFPSRPGFALVPSALSDAAGEATIFSNHEASGLASLHDRDLANYGITLGHRETVSTRRADAYIREAGIGHLHFAKLDVEGHELKVLRGFGDFLDPSFVDCIQFEYGGANLDSGDSLRSILSLLGKRGFVTAKIMQGGLERCDWSPELENYRYSNYVALSPAAFPQA